MRPATPLLLAVLALAQPAWAGVADIRAPGASYSMRVTSLKEARFRNTIRQQYDYSCGSAAVATLLTHHYGHPVSEEQVFRDMFADGNQRRIRREGFSMLDIQRYLASKGFRADGFEVPLEKLAEQGLPAIVLLNDRGYRHFVVVKGLKAGRVLLGDPARGIRTMPLERFEELWDDRLLFVVHNRRELARFNREADWRTAPLAPLAVGVQRQGLQNIVMPKRGPGDI